jgi:hypothetical protein
MIRTAIQLRLFSLIRTLPRSERQAVEFRDVGLGHVLELFAMQGDDRLVELRQKVEASFGDFDHDDAAVVFDAAAFGEVGFHQAIDQARDVWNGGDEFLADGLAGGTGRGVAAEDAEGVIGGVRKAVLAEEAVKLGFEHAGGAQNVQIRFLLRGVEGALLADFFAE